jgi:hypothetical protein
MRSQAMSLVVPELIRSVGYEQRPIRSADGDKSYFFGSFAPHDRRSEAQSLMLFIETMYIGRFP